MGRRAKQEEHRRRRREKRGVAPRVSLTESAWRQALLDQNNSPRSLAAYFSGWLDAHAGALSLPWARSALQFQRGCDEERGDPLAVYDEHLAAGPPCAVLEFQAGQYSYTVAGDLLRAKRHLRAAAALAPQLAGIHYDLGQLYHLLGAFGRAQQAFEQCVATAGEDEPEIAARASFNIGVFLINGGRKPEALPYVQRALELLPDYPQATEALVMLQLSALQAGGAQEALQRLQKLLARR